jgi:hypothetical protein
MTLDLWPQAIAAALGVAALVAPMRVAVLAWLLLVNFDMSGRDFAADSAIGGLNAAKAVGIPLVLLWRTRRLRLPELEAAAPFAAFAALILYAALATLWSPYPLAGVKLVGNLVGVALGAVVLARCFAAGVVTSPMLVACLVGSIAVAVGQTFITADQSFGFSRSVGTARFTSFTASQQFAAWVVVLTAAVLALRTRLATGWLVASVAGAVLMANGSRTWLVCYAAILASFALVKLRSMARMVSIMLLAVVVLGGLLMSSLDANQGGEMGGVARIQAVLSASREGGAAMLMTIDTIGWRFVLYEELVYALQESSPGQLLFGHGTSAAYEVVTSLAGTIITDPNRAAHNEWLRIAYEWGAAGMCLWLLFGASLMLWIRRRTTRQTLPIVIFAGGLMVATLLENLLASAGSGVGVGAGLAVAVLAAPRVRRQPRAERPVRWRLQHDEHGDRAAAPVPQRMAA